LQRQSGSGVETAGAQTSEALFKTDQPGGDRDIAAARATKPDIEDHMAKLGLRLQDFL